jgi:hypothetical protein
MYYSNSKILSYNKLFNFIVGNRGGGKSYNAKQWVINAFLKDGSQFIYLRRYKTELEHIGNYFADVAPAYPDHEFSVKGKYFYIDGAIAGYAVALSTSQKEKSTSYPKVTKIVFDEFIIEKSVYHYIRNEVQLFLDFYETVARTRDVIVEFISNAITMVNPYFTYFKIAPRMGSKFTKYPESVIELYKSDEFIQMKKDTRFGKIISGTPYGDYAIENVFLRDNNTFIEQMTGKCKYWCCIVYMGVEYGVWFNPDNGLIYVNKKTDPSRNYRFCFTTDDHQPNHILLKNIKSVKMIRNIRDAYELSLVRFDNIKTKAAFYEFMALL